MLRCAPLEVLIDTIGEQEHQKEASPLWGEPSSACTPARRPPGVKSNGSGRLLVLLVLLSVVLV